MAPASSTASFTAAAPTAPTPPSTIRRPGRRWHRYLRHQRFGPNRPVQVTGTPTPPSSIAVAPTAPTPHTNQAAETELREHLSPRHQQFSLGGRVLPATPTATTRVFWTAMALSLPSPFRALAAPTPLQEASTTPARWLGWYVDSSGIEHGFVYSGGTYTTLDDPSTRPRAPAAVGIDEFGPDHWLLSDLSGTHGFLASLSPPSPASIISVTDNVCSGS